MNNPVISVNRDNVILYNLSITNDGNPNALAVEIKANNFKAQSMKIENFSIGYLANNQTDITISNNSFFLPNSQNIPIVRAILLNNCKSIKILNNTLIFESLENFKKIKITKEATIQTKEFERLKESIKNKFSYTWLFK